MEQTIKIAWIKKTEGTGKKGAYVKYDIKDELGKYFTCFQNKENELQLFNLRKNMVIKAQIPDTPPKEGYNIQIQKITDVYNTTPSPQASPTSEGGIGRLRPNEPDLVAPMTDTEFNGMIDESIIKASEFLGIPESEAADKSLAVYILKGKLQIQHQRFEIALAKWIQFHKERNMVAFKK